MIDAKPAFPRGTLAYQPHSFGWILGEVVRRVSGQPLDRFLASQLPLPCRLALALRRVKPPRPTGRACVRSSWPASTYRRSSSRSTTTSRRALRWSLGWHVHHRPRPRELLPDAAAWWCHRRRGPPVVGRDPGPLPDTAVVGLDRNLAPTSDWGGASPLAGRCRCTFTAGSAAAAASGHAGGFSTVAFADPATDTAIAYVSSSNRGIPDLLRRSAPSPALLDPRSLKAALRRRKQRGRRSPATLARIVRFPSSPDSVPSRVDLHNRWKRRSSVARRGGP